jgi:2-polyprenyl-3-methyl-5-hydroxy-6-metoxy-1,4-benzoquinol methylase
MMKCCQCQGIEKLFNHDLARKELSHYRRKGPDQTTHLLLDAIQATDVANLTLLDIGGGIGAIQHQLLQAGVSQATNVDASSAYLAAARSEAERLGQAERVNYYHGDFVELADEVGPADIVTLDRVICCYHDAKRLITLSATRAKKTYGLVFPRDTWWMKWFRPLFNALFRIRRHPFRIFLHPTAQVEALLQRQGLEQVSNLRTMLWQVQVYRRPTTAGDQT